jgi:hypothetical protein
METWLHDNSGQVFIYWVYRKMFTPYEQAQQFSDETPFEDTTGTSAFLESAIDLGNGDWLLGFREIFDDEVSNCISYHRLSDISLTMVEDYFTQEEDDPADLP